jgi:hypothetical protein
LTDLVASAISEIAGPATLPDALDALPREDLIPGSERYVAADMFGLAFLPGGIAASYDAEDGQVELFYSELSSASDAKEALSSFRTHAREWGEIVGDVPDVGEGGFQMIDTGLGPGVVVRSGRFIAGVHGGADGRDLVRQLVARLPSD